MTNKLKISAAIMLAGVFAAATNPAMANGALTVDDFTTGQIQPVTINGANPGQPYRATGQGSGILGHVRFTGVTLTANGTSTPPPNPFTQNATITIATWPQQGSALVLSEGFRADAGLVLGYGSEAQAAPLNLNLTKLGLGVLRVHFVGLVGGIDFGFQAYTKGAKGPSYWACTVAPMLNQPPIFNNAFVVDVPLSFAAGQANPASIDGLVVSTESSDVTGDNFGISLIEFVAAGTPPPTNETAVLCGSTH